MDRLLSCFEGAITLVDISLCMSRNAMRAERKSRRKRSAMSLSATGVRFPTKPSVKNARHRSSRSWKKRGSSSPPLCVGLEALPDAEGGHLADERGRERGVVAELDRAFAGLVLLEVLGEGLQHPRRGHEVDVILE